MRIRKNTKGAISVFLCITVSALILCMGLFVDIIRIRSTEIQQQDISVSCMRSALSMYDDLLFDRFRIMGINGENSIEPVMAALLMENSKTEAGSMTVPYHSLQVQTEKKKTLGDNTELKRQILNEEKNRLADQFIDDILGKIQCLTGIKGENSMIPNINRDSPAAGGQAGTIIADVSRQAADYIKGTAKDLLPVFDGEDIKCDPAENFMQSSVDSLKQAGLDLAENMLINEYILKYLENDAERIITGQNDTGSAVATVKAMILGIRTVANTIYFLSDPELMSIASSVAAAAAGWTVLGIPVAQAAVILAWSTAESLLDLETMCAGEKVPLYKSKETWVLSTFGMAEKMGEKLKNEAIRAAKNISDEMIENVKAYADSIVLQLNTYADNAVMSAVDFVLQPLTDLLEEAGSLTNAKTEQIHTACKKALEEKRDRGNVFEKLSYGCAIEVTDEMFAMLKELLNDHRQKISDFIENKKKALKDEIMKPVEMYKEKLLDSISKAAEKGKEEVTKKVEELLGEKNHTDLNGNLSDKVLASFTKFGYKDYLRFFLITCGDEKKINGIRTGIEKEMRGRHGSEFTLNNMVTVWRGNFIAEVKYYFVPPALIPKNYRSENGESHILRKQYEFGYDRGIREWEN